MKSRILVVDDTENLREMLREVLSAHGYDVLVASNGAEALVITACQKVDGVLTDLEMPGLSGIEVCRALRRQNRALGRTLPVWLMTGTQDPIVLRRARSAGAIEFLLKP